MFNASLIAVLLGFGIGFYFALPFEPSIWITLCVIEALIFLAIIFRFYPYKLMIIGYIGVFVFGFANVQLKSHYLARQKPIKKEQTLFVKGQINYKDYNSRGNPRYQLVDVKTFDDKALFNKIRVSIAGSDFAVGDCIELVASLMPPFKPPFYGSYDFSKKAFYQGLQANGYSTTKAYQITCKKPSKPIISNIRKSITEKIYKNVSAPQAGIVSALIAGEKGKVSYKQMEQYRDSGLAHVLSISGMHMSMIAGFMFLFIRTILVLIPKVALQYNIKKISALGAMLMATFYLLISGAHVPTQRAYIMVFIVLLGVLFDRKAISIKNISIAAIIILCISPEVLVSPSFQMSFSAVLALIAFYEKFYAQVKRFIKKFGFIIAYVLGLLIADFIASAATLPFAIYHFNNIAVYTTLGNLLAGPIIGFVIMPFILISIIAMPFSLEAAPLKVVDYGVFLMNKICSYVSSLEGARLEVLSMPTWAFVLIVCGGLFLCLWQGKNRLFGIIPIIIGFFSLMFVEKPLAIYMDNPSKFEKTLITQKYGDVKIINKTPYGAVLYENDIKSLKTNRIWQ